MSLGQQSRRESDLRYYIEQLRLCRQQLEETLYRLRVCEARDQALGPGRTYGGTIERRSPREAYEQVRRERRQQLSPAIQARRSYSGTVERRAPKGQLSGFEGIYSTI